VIITLKAGGADTTSTGQIITNQITDNAAPPAGAAKKSSDATKGAIIAAAVMGTLAIFYGAYLYAKKKQSEEVGRGVLTFRLPPTQTQTRRAHLN